MRISDRYTGLFLVGLGALSAYGGAQLPPVPGQPVGPNVFPVLVGLGLCACGLMIAFGIGHRFEEEAEADLAAVEGPRVEVSHHPLWGLRILIPPALLFFYVFAVDPLGFVPTAAIMAFVAALALGSRLKIAVPLALLAPIGVHLIFAKLLRVPLPAGLLPMPW